MFIKFQKDDGWMLYLNCNVGIRIISDVRNQFNDKGHLFIKDNTVVGAMPKLPKDRSFSIGFLQSLLSSKQTTDNETVFLKKYAQNDLYSVTFGKALNGKVVNVVGFFDNLGIRIDYPLLSKDAVIRFKNSLEHKTTKTFHI